MWREFFKFKYLNFFVNLCFPSRQTIQRALSEMQKNKMSKESKISIKTAHTNFNVYEGDRYT